MITPGISVWVVDDDESVRWVLEQALKQAHMIPRCFDSATKFFAALDDARPDVLVTDIRMPEMSGLELLERLITEADALIENYSAGVMAKLGLDERTLQELNPRLVIVSMPPFGRGGPYQDYRAYGSTVEHASGLPHLNGHPDEDRTNRPFGVPFLVSLVVKIADQSVTPRFTFCRLPVLLLLLL